MTKYFVDLSDGTTLYVEADEYELGNDGHGQFVVTFIRGTEKNVIVQALNPVAWGLVDCVEVQK